MTFFGSGIDERYDYDPEEPGFPALTLEALNELCIQMQEMRMHCLEISKLRDRVYELEMRAGMRDTAKQMDLLILYLLRFHRFIRRSSSRSPLTGLEFVVL